MINYRLTLSTCFTDELPSFGRDHALSLWKCKPVTSDDTRTVPTGRGMTAVERTSTVTGAAAVYDV